MLPKVRSSFNLDEEYLKGKKNTAMVGHPSSYEGSSAIGLRILIHLSHGDSNMICKSSLKLRKPIFTFKMNGSPSISHEYCYLKSCFLCNKNLSPDKDVFMYRGDQGFCSVECRERQIYLDEMRDIETSTKKILASFRRRGNSGRCETSILLEELRQRHEPLSRQKDRAIFLL